MATTTVQIRMDADLKMETEYVLKSIGLTMSSAMNLFCRQVVNQGKIPFELVAKDVPNLETLKSMKDTLEGKNLSRTFSSVDEMWEELNA